MATPVTAQNILKQGYLKRSVQSADPVPSASKLIAKNIKQKLEPSRWYVFVVRNRCPYLEHYDREECVFTGRPIQAVNLSSFQSLSYTMGRTSNDHTFCIILSDRNIELTASSRGQMIDWCRCLERHLRNLGIRSKNQKADHEYTAFPVRRPVPPEPPDTSQSDDSRFSQSDEVLANQLEEMTFEERLLNGVEEPENLGNPDYEDPRDLSMSATLQIRVPPSIPYPEEAPPIPLPRRSQGNKHADGEEVFAIISSIHRNDKMSDGSYTNFKGHDQEPSQKEKSFFDSSSDSSDSENEPSPRFSANKPHVESRHAVRTKNDDDDDDRVTSLPEIVSVHPQESDTSEDADFLGASFWLRNRKSDTTEEEEAESCIPPEPGERLDSLGVSRETADPPVAHSVSVNANSYLHSLNQRSDSPTLNSLGQAPIPQACVEKDTYSNTELQDALSLYDYPKPTAKEQTSPSALYKELPARAEPKSVPSNLSNCDSGAVSNKDDIGQYETLVRRTEGNPISFDDKPSRETTPDLSISQPYETDELYGAAWLCSSVKDQEVTDIPLPKRNNHKEDWTPNKNEPKKSFDTEFEPGMKPEKFTVDLDVPNAATKPADHEQHATNNQSKNTSNKDEGYIKHKHMSKIKKMFSRKSDEIELPETLVVDLPPRASPNSPGYGASGSKELNMYSDLPEHGSSASSANHAAETDKNPLMKPIQNGQPFCAVNRPQLNLPRRDFGELKTPHIFSKSMVERSSPAICNQDTYEDVDMSRSAILSQSTNRPPVPSPPNRRSNKTGTTGSATDDDIPIAPPRRNKKSESGNMNMNKSFQSSSNEVETFEDRPSQPLPRRPGLPPPPSRQKEPAVPPRPSDLHSAPIPPRRPPSIMRASIDAGNVKPHGGARPKTIHLSCRQQSTSPSSGALTVMNLKQNQVDIIRAEIESTGGLVKMISKQHFTSGLALVECFGRIWICGWDVKKFPRLYDKFHIGDELTAINDVQVSELAFANKLVKNVKAESIEITINRTPLAQVFAIQRAAEGECLGIRRDGTSAEIIYVDPNGLASRHGLPNKAKGMEGGPVNWMLTEVNMRPLNLFSKNQEIEHRLLAVGRDISVVVQPSDLVKEIKKNMKKLKNHKDFLLH
ncbi:uncharacterized protein LOC128211570 isoform X1 [Mya arenaria]|uniref:uncharacterized protein LOC128211570 isoform X1 n=2 Tax=Mya arenaria TaxID=6604 RepID=UPI0022E6FC07|nr:uncharacterized protein LOC128211570 isoform X1 [Mya arenaria]XP_052772483.1 uncharacterized protein LOC128211570 isoform X1 [Mya arenaria]